jgi:hypothetical protein
MKPMVCFRRSGGSQYALCGKHFDSHTMWTALGVFFFVVVVWMIHFVQHFYRVPEK